MTKNKIKLLIAYLLTVSMLMGIFSGLTLTAGAVSEPISVVSAHYNTNQEDGITLMKKAVPKEDGTVDISVGAYTTGEVIVHSSVTPTDIILVLDVSGSMNDNVTTSTIQETPIN